MVLILSVDWLSGDISLSAEVFERRGYRLFDFPHSNVTSEITAYGVLLSEHFLIIIENTLKLIIAQVFTQPAQITPVHPLFPTNTFPHPLLLSFYTSLFHPLSVIFTIDNHQL
jgi:hypothetical protein